MTTNLDYDFCIIGGGQAGIPLAWALAEAGKRVALAERKDLGGSCVNFGCTPTKAAIASAKVAHQARRAAEYGLKIPAVEVDFPAVIARAKRIADESREGLNKGLEGADNPKLLRDHARLEGRVENGFRVCVGEQVFTAGQVVLNTGTRSLIPPISGLDSVPFIHAGNWLDHPELPQNLAIIGGGYIGVEMGQFYRRMGSSVAIIEPHGRIVGHEDPDISNTLCDFLVAEGIALHHETTISSIDATNGLTLHIEADNAPGEIQATHIFVATGRKPNTDDLGLETVGVERDEHGNIKVDARLATNVDGLWAAGDIRGGPLFTHTAWDDFRILQSQLLGDKTRTTQRIVPYAIFTDPELGAVGLTETEARRAGHAIKVAHFKMSHNGKAFELGEDEGFIKVILDTQTQRILGAAALCADAAEIIHCIIDIMNADAPYTVIRDAIHIHPTLAEGLQSAVAALDDATT